MISKLFESVYQASNKLVEGQQHLRECGGSSRQRSSKQKIDDFRSDVYEFIVQLDNARTPYAKSVLAKARELYNLIKEGPNTRVSSKEMERKGYTYSSSSCGAGFSRSC